MSGARFGLFLGVAVFSVPVMAGPVMAGESDLTWPQYTQADKSGDAALSCVGFQVEIDHVSADIRQLKKVKDEVEKALHRGFDAQIGGNNDPHTSYIGSPARGGFEDYAKMRTAVKESLSLARERKDHLEARQSTCQVAKP